MLTAKRLVPPTADEVLDGLAVVLDIDGSAQLKLRVMFLVLSQYFGGAPVDLPIKRQAKSG